MAGSAAVAASGVAAHAGTVQITLTGEQVTTGNTGSFTGDLTEDTKNDVTWSVTTGTFSRVSTPLTFQNQYAAVLHSAGGRLAYAAYQSVIGAMNVTRYSYAKAGNDSQTNSPGNPATARALIPFVFTDSRIHDNQMTYAFADVVAFNNSSTSHTVQIVRTVFDDSTTAPPMGVTAGGSNTEWGLPSQGNGNSIASTVDLKKLKKLKKQLKKAKKSGKKAKAKKIKKQIKKLLAG